jgi:hypothetical protein
MRFLRAIWWLLAALVLQAMPGSAQKPARCDADEIHWTITGPSSIALVWRGETSKVRYGATTAYGLQADATTPVPLPTSSSGPFRQVVLTQLRPGKRYHYVIDNCGDHTFRTPPLHGSSKFRFDVEGDVGASAESQTVIPNQRLIAGRNPAVVLMLGDLTYGDPYGSAAVDQHFNDVMVWSQNAAYMPAWGNHEWQTPQNDDLRNYKGRFKLPNAEASPGAPETGCCGGDWSWFDYGNARFISYPEPYSSITWQDWYRKASSIMDGAQDDPAITFIVTFGHRPPYSSGYHDGDLALLRYLVLLRSNHNKYVLNLNGHSHNYERSYPQQGLISITAGVGGSELEESPTNCLFRVCPKPTWSAFRAMHFGVLELFFTSSSIRGSFICGPAGGGKNDIECASGSVVDHFSIKVPR